MAERAYRPDVRMLSSLRSNHALVSLLRRDATQAPVSDSLRHDPSGKPSDCHGNDPSDITPSTILATGPVLTLP